MNYPFRPLFKMAAMRFCNPSIHHMFRYLLKFDMSYTSCLETGNQKKAILSSSSYKSKVIVKCNGKTFKMAAIIPQKYKLFNANILWPLIGIYSISKCTDKIFKCFGYHNFHVQVIEYLYKMNIQDGRHKL
jgi:hypothetical protein